MATELEAATYSEALPAAASARGTIRWSRALPLMLLMPIVFAFGMPAIAFVLLAVTLAAPAIAATAFVLAVRDESGA